MVPFALQLALPVALVASAVVYADAARRGFGRGRRLRWTAGVAGASLSGFVLAFAFESVLVRALLDTSGTDTVVVVTPTQVVATLFTVGLAVSAAAVLAYGFGSRFGPLAAR